MSCRRKASSASIQEVPSCLAWAIRSASSRSPCASVRPVLLSAHRGPALDRLAPFRARDMHRPSARSRGHRGVGRNGSAKAGGAACHRSPHDPARDVAALLVRRHHAVGQQEQRPRDPWSARILTARVVSKSWSYLPGRQLLAEARRAAGTGPVSKTDGTSTGDRRQALETRARCRCSSPAGRSASRPRAARTA